MVAAGGADGSCRGGVVAAGGDGSCRGGGSCRGC